ncbi:MAG TPA: bifunctional 5,10-methylenetetrahydrofolate dehydrogenase/5,10-methenyltetrahydrofolate cyclohydrolase [Methylocystis sp.]|nr:bifunctional 5,10-methylenetetrahydrofolate dehydrogenase/5,10-methenyltetrahydrofolate cyclohydrolase [Methylocystis sp.]
MQLISSKDIVAQRKAGVAAAVAALRARGVAPKLAAVLCSTDPAVMSYVASKRKHIHEVQGLFEAVVLSELSDFADIARAIEALCARPDVHGAILVMSPDPKVDEIDLANAIPAAKDVDGLSAANLGAMLQNGPLHQFIAPATPQACMILAASATKLAGARAVVIGRGRTVGRPLANMLISAGATVTVCHSGTKDMPDIARSADVVFVATGRPRHFGADYFRSGQIVIDAGIGFIHGKVCGDVDAQALSGVDLMLTPTPGGVGPLTSVVILENLLRLIEIGENRALRA